VLVPGGFGDRGVEGKILAAGYARASGKPYLGVCLGFQVWGGGGLYLLRRLKDRGFQVEPPPQRRWRAPTYLHPT
jgi:hypothetical protein